MTAEDNPREEYRGPETCERQKAYDNGAQPGTLAFVKCDCGWCGGSNDR